MGIDIVFQDNIKEVLKKIDDTAKDRMLKAVNEVRNHTLEKLSGQRHGRVYTIPGTNRTYTASSPGEPPAQRLGELRQSIKGGVEGEGSKIVGFVGSDKAQGLMTEFGTKNMAARPWLRKSFEQSQAKVIEICMRVWFS